MDESKAYVILQRLINSYVANELTNRQQRQFEFMLKISEEENDKSEVYMKNALRRIELPCLDTSERLFF